MGGKPDIECKRERNKRRTSKNARCAVLIIKREHNLEFSFIAT